MKRALRALIVAVGVAWLSAPVAGDGIVLTSGDLSLSVGANDVWVREGYEGATWTAESGSVYFARYVEIWLKDAVVELAHKELLKRIDKLFNEAGSPENLDPAAIKGLPDMATFTDPLYEKVIILRHDLADQRTEVIAELDIPGMGSPFFLLFDESLRGDTLRFASTEFLHLLDVASGVEQRIDTMTDEAHDARNVFLGRSDHLALSGQRPVIHRYLSPDRHGFVEIKENWQGDREPRRVGVYYDEDARVATLQELGWRGGTPSKGLINAIEKFQPTYSLTSENCRTEEETRVRQQLGLD